MGGFVAYAAQTPGVGISGSQSFYSRDAIDRLRVGVYVGAMWGHYELHAGAGTGVPGRGVSVAAGAFPLPNLKLSLSNIPTQAEVSVFLTV